MANNYEIISPKTLKKNNEVAMNSLNKNTIMSLRRDDGVIVNNHDVPLIDNVVQYTITTHGLVLYDEYFTILLLWVYSMA